MIGNETLGQRCLDIARIELANGAQAAPYGQPNTSAFVRKYLYPCMRNGKRLGLTQGNWCAAFASWCMQQALQPGDERPHKYRAGVVEIVADAKELGRWFPFGATLAGFEPKPGDLAVWDRSDPERPETSWWRHINRVISYDSSNTLTVEDDRFKTIGGNEKRRVLISNRRPKRLGRGALLGFISYAQEKNTEPFTDEEREHIDALISEMYHRLAADLGRQSLHAAESVTVEV